MAISGIGATPEQPKKPNNNVDPQNPQKPKNSVWIEYTDNDETVDVNDVKILAGPEEFREVFESKIENFLEEHQNEKWTSELWGKLGRVFDAYEQKCVKWQEELKEQTELENKDVLDEYFDQIEAGYTDQFNNFATKANNELKQFNKEGAYEILNDLENGFNGYLNIEGVGIVTYNADSSSYTIKYTEDGFYEDFNKSDIRKLIDEYIDKGVLVSGDSKKTIHK